MDTFRSATRQWSMQFNGVLCVFGYWKARYATLEEGLLDPQVQVVWVFTESDVVPPYEGQAYICIDGTWPMEEVAKAIWARVERPARFCGAASFSEEEVLLANMLNDHLSGGQPAALAVRRRIDKASFYTLLKEAGVPMVRFDMWRTVDELAAIVGSGAYRQGWYVLKPTGASESAGVYRSRPTESLRESVAQFQAYCEAAGRLGHQLLRSDQSFLVMEYIECDGEPVEVTSEVLVRNGEIDLLVVHEKRKTAAFAPFFDQIMVAPPVSPSIMVRLAEIREVTRIIVSALSIQQSVLHIEFRLTRESCIPIDCAIRPGGGFIPHAVYMLSGVDLRLAHVASHLIPLAWSESIGAPGVGGTCIGALYAPHFPSPQAAGAFLPFLSGQPAVFALSANEEQIGSPMFTADAAVSLGVQASTSSEALALYDRYAALAAGRPDLRSAQEGE
jgi:hypothetical protein